MRGCRANPGEEKKTWRYFSLRELALSHRAELAAPNWRL
jgi:hypothetical protein